ncbi:MAG: Fur family transcriptional regulator [Candidatus Andersenbacteria bacterium]
MNATDFRKLLHAKSYKATPSRLAMLALLSRVTKPLSVPDIRKRLGGKHYDQATVYRTLLMLKKMGIVKQIDFQHGMSYYELSARGDHHHVICTTCERIEDVQECCVVGMDSLVLQQSGFAEITQHSLEFFGICKRCKA